jgi:hypothetical protein
MLSDISRYPLKSELLMIRIWLALLLACTVAVGRFGNAPPTRCFMPRAVSEELEKSDAVFTGKVIAEEYQPVKPTSDDGEVLTVKLAVERWWKGEMKKEVTLYTQTIRYPNGMTSFMEEDFCFQVGMRYLVYASDTAGKLRTNGCRRTKSLVQADDDLRELGEGRPPEKKGEH